MREVALPASAIFNICFNVAINHIINITFMWLIVIKLNQIKILLFEVNQL